MFRWKKDDSKEVVAFLDKGTEFKGILTFEGTIRVDGKVEGEIISDGTLIVGEGAFINGNINVGNLISHGSIQGDITAKNKVSLLPSSILRGNIKTSLLTIEEGAMFEGQSIMVKEDKKVIPIDSHKERIQEG